ncbi:MAG: TrmH family RNA methyltransferase [Chitinophagaceae bacterium]|nr:MAG: TrmH family RNA methyltransferase [Chitinophagaceae bacterium]
MDLKTRKEVIDHLYSFISESKKKRMNQVLGERTKFLTLVLEDVYQPQIVSSIVKTCDCFGIQDLHLVENFNKYSASPDAIIAATKWVNIHRYREKNSNNTQLAINELRDSGYQIVTVTNNRRATSIDEFPMDKKTAVIFGPEKSGPSDVAIKQADAFVKIPLLGFSDYLNLPVTTGAALNSLRHRMVQSKAKWQLDENEIDEVKYFWAHKLLKSADRLEDVFLNK